MDPALTALITQIVLGVLKELLTDTPAIKASLAKVMTSTLADSKSDPALTDALRKAQAQAIAAGQLPPADLG